jgi:hypothetical protein
MFSGIPDFEIAESAIDFSREVAVFYNGRSGRWDFDYVFQTTD